MKKVLIAVLLSLCITFPVEAKEPQPEYQEYIKAVCETYSISPELVESIIFYESSWCTSAVSASGCHLGLMQIAPASHRSRMKRLGMTDMTNGYQNIMVGCDYLAELFEEYEDVAIVLDVYNGQLHSVEWYEAGNMSSYSRKVLDLAEDLENERNSKD